MQTTVRQRSVNPRLGTYFGIYTAAFAALAIVVLILEQLGGEAPTLRLLMLAGPLLLYVTIGIGCRTDDPVEYFAAGRRVPAAFAGLVTAVTAVGGTGLVALTGAFFLHGFDTWCIATGIGAGAVLAGVMLAPFLRKHGAYTPALYLGRRYESRLLRILTAALIAVPLLLVLVAELQIAVQAARWLTGFNPRTLLAIVVAVSLSTLLLGGVRAMTWSATAQAIAALIAIVVPASLVAVLAGNLPIPQFSHGPTLRHIGRLEVVQAIPIPLALPFQFDIAGQGLSAVTQRFAKPFGSVGPVAYVLASLVIMVGIAAAPWLMARSATTPGVYDARKAQGWAAFYVAVIALTLAAIAVFLRDQVMSGVVGQHPSRLPEWFGALVASGHAAVDGMSPRIPLTGVSIDRDATLYALPLAAGFPAVVLQLALVGVIAAALAGIAAAATALANAVGEDIVGGASWEPLPPAIRIAVARVALVATLISAAAVAATVNTDPLRLMLWAIGLSASSLAPAMILSVWSKRLHAPAVFAGMLAGFVTCVGAIIADEAGVSGLPSELAAVLGLPASLAALMTVALLSPRPARSSLEFIGDLRVPGGETIYDREMRLLRLKQRHAERR
jgi:cation/acetate symporter